jgi:hypothetical protein
VHRILDPEKGLRSNFIPGWTGGIGRAVPPRSSPWIVSAGEKLTGNEPAVSRRVGNFWLKVVQKRGHITTTSQSLSKLTSGCWFWARRGTSSLHIAV